MRLKRLNDIYMMGNISESEYRTKSADLQKRIASLTRAEVSKSEVFIKNWKEVYQMLDSAHKRAFWHRLIYRIEMNGKEVKKLYFL